MITFENISISYDGDKQVITSLNAALPNGSIHGLAGLNGSGKTTLLEAIFGLKALDNGQILWNGKPINRQSIAYLVTEPYFYHRITGREYLSLFKNKHFDTEGWNKLFGLPLEQLIDQYSTGMKKKLAILSILKLDKPIILLDEPFNGLDIETGRVLRSVLLRLKTKDKIILITSHILETLTNLCDYIHYLEDGTIRFSKGKDEFESFSKELFDRLEGRNLALINELLDE